MKKRYILIPVFLLILLGIVVLKIHSFLSPIKPVSDAKILVVDAWLNDNELAEAVKVFTAGNYSYVLVPGGKMNHALFFPGMNNIADVSAVILMYKGMPYDKIIPLPVKSVRKDRTYQSALAVQQWIKERKLGSTSLNLFTSSTHARRSWLLYKKAFDQDCKVGIIASQAYDYRAARWWKSSNGFRTVVDESVAFLYAFLFFHPDL